jgi:hypothetical protein
MRTFAQKPKATQPTTPAKSIPGRAHVGQTRDPNSVLNLQRTIGNQAVQRLLEGNTGNDEKDSSTAATPRVGHEFSQIPAHSPAPVRTQPQLAVSTPEDALEQEAARVADTVMRAPDPGVPPAAREDLGADGMRLEPKTGARIQAMRGDGHALTPSERDFMEPRFGADFGAIRIHTQQEADAHSRALHARAFTLGSDIYFRAGEYRPGQAEGRRLLAHELTHTIQQGAAGPTTGGIPVRGTCPPTIQREMGFEFQTTNSVFRNDGKTPVKLDRKYGPQDFLVKGSTGVQLQSETGGVLEFDVRWDHKWSKLKAQIEEAVDMTRQMNNAKDVGGGRKEFPFDVSGLRTGTAEEIKRGMWGRKPGMEGPNEKILAKGEGLEVHISDDTWNAGIQSSETFELSQYESFLKEHEFPDYREPVIASAQAILDRANTKTIDAAKLVNLRNFLEIIVNYIKRGKGGKASEDAGAFADVKGMPSKQAFTLMNRTNFASIYKTLLSPDEKKLFNEIVSREIILKEMGLATKSPFFIKGYGKDSPQKGPTVHEWLTGIAIKGIDLLAFGTGPGLSAAMGKSEVNTRPGEIDSRLVKFETRNRPPDAWRTAKDWVTYAHDLFKQAVKLRPRKVGKGETGLDYS